MTTGPRLVPSEFLGTSCLVLPLDPLSCVPSCGLHPRERYCLVPLPSGVWHGPWLAQVENRVTAGGRQRPVCALLSASEAPRAPLPGGQP